MTASYIGELKSSATAIAIARSVGAEIPAARYGVNGRGRTFGRNYGWGGATVRNR